MSTTESNKATFGPTDEGRETFNASNTEKPLFTKEELHNEFDANIAITESTKRAPVDDEKIDKLMTELLGGAGLVEKD